MAANGGLQPIIEQMQLAEQARAGAQEAFLRVSQGMTQTLEQAINMQMQLMEGSDVNIPLTSINPEQYRPTNEIECQFDREACMEFAIGSIGKMLGDRFADIDQHPSRVRLPDEPLMLVDRILEVNGEADALMHDLSAKRQRHNRT